MSCRNRLLLIFRSRSAHRGIAQKAIRLCENIHGSDCWILDTIMEEAGNCHLYEKMGYHETGHKEKINDKLTLVFYAK